MAQDVTIDLGLDKCDICKEVVTLAEGALQQNKTEEEIASAVNSLCTSAFTADSSSP